MQLDETGAAQVAAVAERLATVPLAAVVSSPLERCSQTAAAVAAGRDLDGPGRRPARRGPLRRLDRPAAQGAGQGPAVEGRPAAPVGRGRSPAPRGRGCAQTQARAVAAVRDWNAALGPDAVWLACSHGDVIKAILADALGLHLDQFQRIVVDPASISVVTLHRDPARSSSASTTPAATSPR